MDYKSITLHEDFRIDQIVTVHYFEYTSDFKFDGESHDFWEFLCVDKGEVSVMSDSHKISLKKGDIIFHKPNEFHNVTANGLTAPNLVVIAFICDSPRMSFFENKILTIGEVERNLLASIIIEAMHTFSSPLDDPYLEEMEVNQDHPFGSQQLIKINLEHILIQLYRRYTALQSLTPITKSIKAKNDEEIYNRIINYLEGNMQSQLTIEQICRDNLISRSQLQKLFREKKNCGIIDYFCKIKIDAAKQLIRNKNMNFTQIADTLGYTSIHYFSRQFKKVTGMTPSEYASSIKVFSERHDGLLNSKHTASHKSSPE